ncbi:MAG: Flagellin and related hook-associated protein FlgL [Candidatus Midichloria mitochondrii]|uniref:Flagellin fliC n=3 Tax=Candidatus Midichloria mitochondrii TaxID=234827 RepID=F7XW47_MIDMI|nr:flagellar biosynthesis protein FliC [Candidatus Midichloria mitochondrii]AEI88896.1 flagellin fliC [Candidatus Midichloria mitochondrii IricVA]MDJ1256086.1 hypothetical protein [Candidatus Midichloria mitochondrii]MDJ1287789.1 hypothetical protein [Candidatus Midichloria mitochondrii]MDJ1298628.1 hypothetical protein [Candidatus Midichloria mitochondrii]MDJ1312820.1 hypothetical protein [Candidatus Midichloria mitochondrii]
MATISIGGYDTRGIGTLLNNYAEANTAITKRLSTGQRASAAEDPAKDSLAARIEKTVVMLRAALDGTAIAKSVGEVAEGAATQILRNVQTLSELAIRAANTVSEQDKKLLDSQFQGIMAETDRIAKTTKFGDQVLLNGSLEGGNNLETDITGVSDVTKSYSSLTHSFNKPDNIEINGIIIKANPADVIAKTNAAIDAIVGKATGADAATARSAAAAEAAVQKSTIDATAPLSQPVKDAAKATIDAAIAASNSPGIADAAAVQAAISGFKVDPASRSTDPVKHEILYAADQAVITLKKGTAQKVDLFKLEEIYIDDTNKKDVTFGIDGTATNTDADIKISNVAGLDAKGRAQAFADAVSVNPVLRNTFKATVVSVGDGVDEAKLILNRTSTGHPGGVSFKASVDKGSADLAAQVKSLQVGAGIIEVSDKSLAASYSANNSVIVGEQITVNADLADLATKVAGLFQNATTTEFALQSSRDTASMLSATVKSADPTAVDFKSKRQGSAGNFLLKDLNVGSADSAQYDNVASVGSLGVGNVFVSGGVKADALIKSVGGAVATTGFVKVDNATLVEGSKIKFGGREFTLRGQIKDPSYEIQLKAGDPVQTLKNIAVFLNSSSDPSLSNFIFETKAVASSSGTTVENQLKISSKVFSADYNDAIMTIEEPVVTASTTTTATLKLADGFADGLDLSSINDNKDFLGQLKGFKTFFEGSNRVKLQLSVGDYMYEGIVEDTNPIMDTKIIMRSNKDLGGYFTISLGGGRGFDVNSADDAVKFAASMDMAFEQLEFYQQREISSFSPNPGSSVDNMSAYLVLPGYAADLNVVSVEAESAQATGDASITVKTSDGKVFKNRAGVLGSSTNVGEKIELVEERDSNSKIVLIFGKDVDFTNDASTERFQTDLVSAFKANLSPMQFQVGEGEDDIISVKFADLTADTLFKGEKLSIGSTSEMRKASKVLNDALMTVISARANIGGLLQTLAASASALEQNIITTNSALDVMKNADITSELAKYTENSNKIEAGAYVLSSTRDKSARLIQVLFR